MTGRDVVATAEAVLALMEADEFGDVVDMVAPSLRELVSAESLRDSWRELSATHGSAVQIGTPSIEPAGADHTLVKIGVTCERGAYAVLMVIDGSGRLHGLQFAPPGAAEPMQPWEAPPYVDPAAFTEHEVTVGEPPWATPGTLSLPQPPRPGPAIVLIAGSGPSDRDVTMGRNKIFRDLAWGLASRGIAVLRFDKVTYVHRDTIDVRAFTAFDEFVRPGVAAVRLLREHPMVDGDRIFVLGHSQGGTMAPRIAAAEPSVAGLVLLAGATEPMHRSVLRQVRYLATVHTPSADPEADPSVQTITRQVALIDDPDLSPSTPDHLLPLGVPAPYWLDLRGYDPVAVAAQLDLPMLIMQGGRDYQVTVTDDLAGWQNGLADPDNVTIRVYPADDHLFFPGSGPSTPASYEPAQHVDEAVVTDIVRWVDGTTR
ncbi:serine aminopeptidase domain-containing protein [Mycobacterium sp. G7A2]|uniref:alpha/beta hydrolase n=1 Tax=Mycobacterium sp. G7A2 TaxID=3317307 RepID=UPI0035A8D1DD